MKKLQTVLASIGIACIVAAPAFALSPLAVNTTVKKPAICSVKKAKLLKKSSAKATNVKAAKIAK